MNTHSSEKCELLQETEELLQWYDSKRRRLPWREDPTPYHVWLSEIMLQQTRVEAAIRHYLRFLEELPDIASLADADEEQCLKLWEGLGYYSRVRNLRKAAIMVRDDLDGVMPHTAAQLAKLPGVGEYTAAAIASIAFGQAIPSIDGNLLRIFARRTACSLDLKKAAGKGAAREFYSDRIPQDRPGDYNQALMDLGATICLPNGAPSCSECPWAERCQAHEQERELDYPAAVSKARRTIEKLTVLVICDRIDSDQSLHSQCRGNSQRDDLPSPDPQTRPSQGEISRVLLRKRPDTGLLAGLYEFPNLPEQLNKKQVRQYLEELSLSPKKIEKQKPAKHIFSHKEWHMTGYLIFVDSLDPLAETRAQSAEDSESDAAGPVIARFDELETRYAIPSAFGPYLPSKIGR